MQSPLNLFRNKSSWVQIYSYISVHRLSYPIETFSLVTSQDWFKFFYLIKDKSIFPVLVRIIVSLFHAVLENIVISEKLYPDIIEQIYKFALLLPTPA